MGRPDLFALYQDDPTFLERFDKLCESIKDDRKIAEIIALDRSRFPHGINPRTIQRARLKRDKMRFNDLSLAPANEFFEQKEAEDWWKWVQTQVKPQTARNISRYVIEIWEKVWNKKRLLAIRDDQDIINATAYIKGTKPRGSLFNAMLALRYLIRFGFGKAEWRDKFLRTKGLQTEPRVIDELMSADFYEKIFPKLLEKARTYDRVQANGKSRPISDREKDEFEVTAWAKLLCGIRTGNREEQRELWGTMINGEGRTRIAVDSEGHVKSWTVFAKRNEIWRFDLMPRKLQDILEAHIAKYQLKSGEYLLRELDSALANRILKKACRDLGITPLNLHDLRKAYLTGLRLCGIPLEAAIDLMVGWKKIDTAKTHYLMLKLARVSAYVRKLFEPIPTEVSRSFMTYVS